MALHPVIMCGGSGTRLWPASRAEAPKQFLRLVGPRSLFQETALRVSGIPGAVELVVVSGASHVHLIRAQLAELGLAATILLEPEGRDSAPAMAAACAWVAALDKDGVAVVVASDHHIPDVEAFRAACVTAAGAARSRLIVTMGVAPRYPSTAYGYIEPGAALGDVREVSRFVEKPDELTARSYIASGYLWNSGNFVVRAVDLLTELDAHAPAIAKAAREAVSQTDSFEGALKLGEAFRAAPKISIDYAVMEKTEHAAVLPVDFEWSDLGGWDAIWAAREKDGDGNAIEGEALLIGSRDTLVRAGDGMQVTVVGANKLAVIADSGQVLVCDQSAATAVKTAVEHWKSIGRERMPASAPFDDLNGAASWFDRWLRASALPLWWSLGADHARGGFYEALSPEGEPLELPRRGRVQARQAFVYAQAGLIGWPGPWRQAAWHAFDDLVAKYKRPDGCFRALAAPDGAVLDDTALLYDQAFALLAMATLHRAEETLPSGTRRAQDLPADALALLTRIRTLRHAKGGYREAPPHPFQANAQMHLFEAALAWIEAGGGADWDTLAGEIAELALRRMIDAKGGFIREYFGDDWSPAPGGDGRKLQPGHNFEWAWLLERWGRRGHPEASAAAHRLFAAGVRGVDPRRGVAVDEMLDDFTGLSGAARLWPQTEFLKAALVLGDHARALTAAQSLYRYLDTPAPGAWRDKMGAGGAFLDEPAPASTFYHLAGACSSLASRSDVVNAR